MEQRFDCCSAFNSLLQIVILLACKDTTVVGWVFFMLVCCFVFFVCFCFCLFFVFVFFFRMYYWYIWYQLWIPLWYMYQ